MVVTRIACLMLLLAGVAGAQTIETPLNVAISPSDSGRQTLLVTNTSGQPITAYAIELTIQPRQGAPFTTQHQRDGFYLADRQPLLAPNQTAEFAVPLMQGASVADVSVSAVAVTLDNATVVGSPALGARILDNRAWRRDDMLYWLTATKESIARNSGNASAMVTDLENLASASEKSSPAAAGLLQNLRILDRMPSVEREARVSLLLDQLERDYANAVKHAGAAR